MRAEELEAATPEHPPHIYKGGGHLIKIILKDNDVGVPKPKSLPWAYIQINELASGIHTASGRHCVGMYEANTIDIFMTADTLGKRTSERQIYLSQNDTIGTRTQV